MAFKPQPKLKYTRFKPRVQGSQPNQEAEAPRASDVSQHQPHVSEYQLTALATHAHLSCLKMAL
jgi:hypothetical protein